MNKFIFISFLFFIFSCTLSPSPTPFPHTQNLSESNTKYEKIGLNWIDMPQFILFGSGLITLFWFILLYLCNQVNFVTFNTNLSLFKKNVNPTLNFSLDLWLLLSIILQWLILSEYPDNFSIQCYLHFFPNVLPFTNINRNVSKSLTRGCFHISCIFIFTESISPPTLVLSIFVFQIWCHTLSKNIPQWLPLILILLANDIELNPGPP